MRVVVEILRRGFPLNRFDPADAVTMYSRNSSASETKILSYASSLTQIKDNGSRGLNLADRNGGVTVAGLSKVWRR